MKAGILPLEPAAAGPCRDLIYTLDFTRHEPLPPPDCTDGSETYSPQQHALRFQYGSAGCNADVVDTQVKDALVIDFGDPKLVGLTRCQLACHVEVVVDERIGIGGRLDGPEYKSKDIGQAKGIRACDPEPDSSVDA